MERRKRNEKMATKPVRNQHDSCVLLLKSRLFHAHFAVTKTLERDLATIAQDDNLIEWHMEQKAFVHIFLINTGN